MVNGCGLARTCPGKRPCGCNVPTINRSLTAFAVRTPNQADHAAASGVVVTDAENNLAPARCSTGYWQAYHLFLWRARLGGESREDRHVNMDRLILNNREGLCSNVQTLGHASFHIDDILARRKRRAIISVSVRSNSRDLLSFALGQDDQRIVSIVFRCHWDRPRFCRPVFVSELDRPLRNNLQLSLNRTLSCCVN